VPGHVLLDRPHIQQHKVPVPGHVSGAEFFARDLGRVICAEVLIAGGRDSSLVGFGDLAQQREQPRHILAGQTVVDPHTFAAGGDKPSLLEGL